MDNKRKIKILTPGGIPGKAFVNGPILTPYYEKESVIFNLLSKGVEVIEVLGNGAERKLTITNLNNSEPTTATKKEQPKVKKEEVVKESKPEKVIEKPVVEEVKIVELEEKIEEEPETVEEVKNETVDEVSKDVPSKSNMNYNKKPKNKQNNKYVQVDDLKTK